MENRIEDLVNSYIRNLSLLNDKELFMQNLPNLFFDSSVKIINSIIDYLTYELNLALEMLDSEYGDDKIVLTSEIDLIKNKIEWCNEKLCEKHYEEIEEQELEQSSKLNIVFSKKKGNNTTYFEENLSSIPMEYYKDIFDCLTRTRKFGFNENNEKQKMIGSVNKKLKGICELKNYQVRIIYKVLDKNTIYITQVYIKKDDKTKRIIESMINRDAKIYEYFLEIKDRIKDENYKKDLLSENIEIENKILESYKYKGEVSFAKD